METKWNSVQNAVCVYELKDYQRHIRASADIGVKEAFASDLLRRYPLLSEHSAIGVCNRLDYLCEVALEELGGETSLFDQKEEIDIEIDEEATFVGYGDIPNAKIMFFADEKAIGYEAMKKSGYLSYWDGQDEPFNRVHWKTCEWKQGRVSRVKNNAFLKISARLMLALEHQELESVDHWFIKQDKHKDQLVKSYIMEDSLFSNRPGLKTALFDYKARNVDEVVARQRLYQRSTQDNFTKSKFVLLNEIVKKSSVSFLLSFGSMEARKQLFEKYWEHVSFERVTLQPSNKEVYISTKKFGQHTTIILAEDLSYEHFGYPGARDLTKLMSSIGVSQ